MVTRGFGFVMMVIYLWVVSVSCSLHFCIEAVLFVSCIVNFPDSSVGFLEGVVTFNYVTFAGLMLALDVVGFWVVNAVFKVVVWWRL